MNAVKESGENREIECGGIMEIVNQVSAVMEKTVETVFASNCHELIDVKPGWILCAVWGVSETGTLTATQQNIHREIHPVVAKVLESMKLISLGDAQKTAIVYIIRNMMTYKLLFMVERYKGTLRSDRSEADILALEVAGHA